MNSTELIKTIELFVFCYYPDNWLPRAILIPLEFVDDNIQNEINKLIEIGPIIEQCHKKHDTNYNSYVISHYLTGNNEIIEPDTTFNGVSILTLINTWTNLADNLHHYWFDNDDGIKVPKWIMKSMQYYINDLNRHLPPKELYQKILNMTNHDGYQIKVKNCVMLVEQSKRNKKIFQKPIRVFYSIDPNNSSDKIITNEQIEEILYKNFKINNITLSSANYGYVYLKDPIKEDELFNKVFDIDGIKFCFDS
jgi:hypothetical protein